MVRRRQAADSPRRRPSKCLARTACAEHARVCLDIPWLRRERPDLDTEGCQMRARPGGVARAYVFGVVTATNVWRRVLRLAVRTRPLCGHGLAPRGALGR